MVAKGTQDRRSSSSTNASSTTTASTKRRVPSASQDKKKIVKPIGICGFCLGDNEKNANGISEEMIHCAECGNSGHPSCLQYSEKLVKKIKTIRWQCIDCKRCIVCSKGDDSLLFCDFCDSGIHPKCCDPPLNNIPKGDFACHLCQDELTNSPQKSLIKTSSSSSSSSSPTRSQRSNHINEDEKPTPISRPVAQLIDGMSNFFLPNKQQINNIRQQSVQKAMKYLREKKSTKLLKRLHSSTLDTKLPIQENNTFKNQLIAKSILASSKTQRIRKKPLILNEDLPSSPQTSTPLLTRQLSNKKPLTIEPITPPPRIIRQSGTQPIEELNRTNSSRSANKRKHSANSISPISTTSSISKKRTREDSPTKKIHSKNSNQKRKESKTEDDQSDNEFDDKQNKSTADKRKLNLDLSKYKNIPAFLNDSLPDFISENEIYVFLDARKNSSKLITDCSDKFHHSTESIDDDATNTRWPPYIVFGFDLIKTWYSSSYPQEYARVPRLYICEFCLKYIKCEQVYDRHRKKCTAFHPPANEIYHKDDLSVFEVDGNINRIYCQNLCLLAKLFLDHKTLYYDVEPFLFYVLTRNDANGCHFIGYFSKEKHCPQKYNLSCITVLPNCQRRGYGRFLIELSYLLSQKEGQFGTPERPLSTLGAQTYEAYWKIKLVEQLLISYNDNKDKCTLKYIMNETGMTIDDIIETLQNLGVLTMKSNGKPVITLDVTQLEMIMKNEKIKHAHWVSLDSEYLRFTPVLTHLLLTNEEKAIERQVKEIQIVFKEIGRDAAEAATLAAESADGTNNTEVVRYIRRRKFGQKRRSMYIKRRIPIKNKSNKTEPITTHDDSCTTDIITNDDDEHSQEYISRRRISTINESMKEEEQEEEEETIQISSSPKILLKQPIFKQLKLDQFLKVVQPAEIDPPPSIGEKSESNYSFVSCPDNDNEETDSANKNDSIQPEVRRITRHTRLQSTTSRSETDLIKIVNGTLSDNVKIPDFNHQDVLIRQLSEGGLSTASSNDSSSTINTLNSSSISNMDRPLPLKKRVWASSNLPTLVDTTISPSENVNEIEIDQPILNRETSVTTTIVSEISSSLSDILANPLISSSSSTNGTDKETKIACIESQLKSTVAEIVNNDGEQVLSINSFETTIKPVESSDDESPPSLTSPTSMIVSQSSHYNYPTRGKQQQTINNFNTSTNTTYNYGNTSFPYTYPPAPSIDMQPFYYPPTTSMDYMPYYPSQYSTSSPSVYPPDVIFDNTPEEQSLYYPPNGVNPISYNGNGTAPYGYSTAPATGRH